MWKQWIEKGKAREVSSFHYRNIPLDTWEGMLERHHSAEPMNAWGRTVHPKLQTAEQRHNQTHSLPLEGSHLKNTYPKSAKPLAQGSADFIYKKPVGKYFGLCGHSVSITPVQLYPTAKEPHGQNKMCTTKIPLMSLRRHLHQRDTT
jgi:hypothetical protein